MIFFWRVEIISMVWVRKDMDARFNRVVLCSYLYGGLDGRGNFVGGGIGHAYI
jgi:hypothetical protein